MSSYIPPEKRDTSWMIFHQLFHCRMRYIDTRTIEDLEEFGMPTLFDKQADRETANHLVDVYITINDMVEHFKNGINLRVVSKGDVERIYRAIEAHLVAWKLELARNPFVMDPPIDDLVWLDRFNNVVYDKGKFYFTEEYLNTLTGHTMNSSVANISNYLRSLTVRKQEVSNESPEKPDYKTMAEMFNEHRSSSFFEGDG